MSENQMPIPPGARPEASKDVLELDAANEKMPSPAPAKAPKRKLKVRALRAGFIHNERKIEGDKFEVDGIHQLGSWMECEDPIEQKKHLQRIFDKKKKANAKGLKDQEQELADE